MGGDEGAHPLGAAEVILVPVEDGADLERLLVLGEQGCPAHILRRLSRHERLDVGGRDGFSNEDGAAGARAVDQEVDARLLERIPDLGCLEVVECERLAGDEVLRLVEEAGLFRNLLHRPELEHLGDGRGVVGVDVEGQRLLA